MSNIRFTWAHGCFLCYVVLTAFAGMYHEPWRDEAQAWLIARDLPLDVLFAQANYEGAPVLWHLILAPFARSGAPYVSMQVIHLLIAYAIVYLFLFKSRFSVLTRVLFVFSYYMCWEYAVIARNYNLSILFIFLLAVNYEKRGDHPLRYAGLLLLLFNTNVHSMALALGLSLVFVYETFSSSENKRRSYQAGSIILLGLFVAVLQLLPAPDNINAELFHVINWKRPFIALGNAFFPHVPASGYITTWLALLIVALSGIIVFLKSKSACFVLATGYLGIFYVLIFKHAGSLRHHGLLLIFLLFAIWITSEEKPRRLHANTTRTASLKRLDNINVMAINLCLVVSLFFSVRFYVWEYQYPFSGARQAAAFLNQYLDESGIVVAHPSIKASALAPFMPGKQFWYADVEAFGTFITWNSAYEAGRDITPYDAIQRSERRFRGKSGLIYIFDEPLPVDLLANFTLVYETEGEVFGYGEERYFVYRRRD